MIATVKQDIEAIYPLTSTQEGMLFHSIYAAGSGVYFQQSRCTLEGLLDVPAFKHAWQQVMDRHQVLRTSFSWELKRHPLQIVRRRVELPWEQHDWRSLRTDEQSEQLQQHLKTDRKSGFVLNRAPLMRCALIQMSAERFEFIWSYHHILLDGWSVSLLLKEVFVFYEAARRSQELTLEQPRPFQDYLVWFKEQQMSEAEAFWRRSLKGFSAATPFDNGPAQPRSVSEETESGAQQLELSVATTTALEAFTRRSQVTLSVLVEGVWALLLSRYSGDRD